MKQTYDPTVNGLTWNGLSSKDAKICEYCFAAGIADSHNPLKTDFHVRRLYQQVYELGRQYHLYWGEEYLPVTNEKKYEFMERGWFNQ